MSRIRVAFRVPASDNFPAHRTIADFRQRHLPEFQALFVQLVLACFAANLRRLHGKLEWV